MNVCLIFQIIIINSLILLYYIDKLVKVFLQKMKFSEIKQYEGQCCFENLIKAQIDEQLHCMICYQVMTSPIALSCPSNHTFGMSCLKTWSKNKQQILCPYCRCKTKTWNVRKDLEQKLDKFQLICQFCQEWKGTLKESKTHKDSCQSYYKNLKQNLATVVSQQKKQLEKQINPHLREVHKQIFEKYVEDWIWLESDLRDWKWWWWCNNPWWNNISCQKCNLLWHRYELKINQLELKRINLINRISHFDANKQIKIQIQKSQQKQTN